MKQQLGSYTIELSNGNKIPVRFCTWSLKRFCELNGNLSLKELQDALGEGITLERFISLILCAAEYVCVKEKKDFIYTEMDASDWIDEMGGISGKGVRDMLLAVTIPFTPELTTVDKVTK